MSSSLLRTIGNSLFNTKLSWNLSVCSVRGYEQDQLFGRPRNVFGKRARPGQPPFKTRKQVPFWFTRRNRTIHDDFLTNDNREFLSEVVTDRYGEPKIVNGVKTYPHGANDDSILVKVKEMQAAEWTKQSRRVGVIARKIGNVPLWLKNGKQISTTMLQVEDNHVIKYIPPGEYKPTHVPKHKKISKFGCLMVGACGTDPSMFTKSYCGLFADTGVAPKKHLGRFIVTPDAALPVGTPLNALHFRVGDYVDVRGKTIDRGFQGVMVRWGFKGMPASHGQTKTHRRPGNIGSGGTKARVWPGQKLPGHMGNAYRIARGLKIWRINTKHNVLWVSGVAIPGETNAMVYIYDTVLPLRKPETNPPFPTYVGNHDKNQTDIWSDELHNFKDSTITFEN